MPESNYTKAIVYRGIGIKTYGAEKCHRITVVKLSPAEHDILIDIFRKEKSKNKLYLLLLAHLFKP